MKMMIEKSRKRLQTNNMAATRDSPVESQHRSSLLNVVLTRTEALKRKALIHRLIYIGKLSPDQPDKRELGEYYDKFFKNHNNHQSQMEPVTGLLLIYPQHFIHVLEASNGILVESIRDLEAKQKRGTLIKEAKILMSVGNLSEALALTLKLGYQLSRVPKLSLKTSLDQMHDKYRELLIPQDIIEKMLRTRDLSDPSEFLKKYHSPLDIALDRDLVWPAETKLFPL